jgi:micrococcal nuclease
MLKNLTNKLKTKKAKECLEKCDIKSINYLTMEGFNCYAKCISCYDGDTVQVVAPFRDTKRLFKFKCRLLGINTPELRTKDLEEKKKGYEARDFLRNKILDKIIWVEFSKPDKYGRDLCQLFDDEDKKINFNQLMIDEGLAMSYDGKGKKNWK